MSKMINQPSSGLKKVHSLDYAPGSTRGSRGGPGDSSQTGRGSQKQQTRSIMHSVSIVVELAASPSSNNDSIEVCETTTSTTAVTKPPVPPRQIDTTQPEVASDTASSVAKRLTKKSINDRGLEQRDDEEEEVEEEEAELILESELARKVVLVDEADKILLARAASCEPGPLSAATPPPLLTERISPVGFRSRRRASELRSDQLRFSCERLPAKLLGKRSSLVSSNTCYIGHLPSTTITGGGGSELAERGALSRLGMRRNTHHQASGSLGSWRELGASESTLTGCAAANNLQQHKASAHVASEQATTTTMTTTGFPFATKATATATDNSNLNEKLDSSIPSSWPPPSSSSSNSSWAPLEGVVVESSKPASASCPSRSSTSSSSTASTSDIQQQHFRLQEASPDRGSPVSWSSLVSKSGIGGDIVGVNSSFSVALATTNQNCCLVKANKSLSLIPAATSKQFLNQSPLLSATTTSKQISDLSSHQFLHQLANRQSNQNESQKQQLLSQHRRQSLQISLLTGDYHSSISSSSATKSLTEEELRGEREFNEQVRASKSPEAFSHHLHHHHHHNHQRNHHHNRPLVVSPNASQPIDPATKLSPSSRCSPPTGPINSSCSCVCTCACSCCCRSSTSSSREVSPVSLATGEQSNQHNKILSTGEKQSQQTKQQQRQRRVSFGSIDPILINRFEHQQHRPRSTASALQARLLIETPNTNNQNINQPFKLLEQHKQKRHSLASNNYCHLLISGSQHHQLINKKQPPDNNSSSGCIPPLATAPTSTGRELRFASVSSVNSSSSTSSSTLSPSFVQDTTSTNNPRASPSQVSTSPVALLETDANLDSKRLADRKALENTMSTTQIEGGSQTASGESPAGSLSMISRTTAEEEEEEEEEGAEVGVETMANRSSEKTSIPLSTSSATASGDTKPKRGDNSVQSIMANARLRQEEFARLLEEHEQIVNEINRVETKISLTSQTSMNSSSNIDKTATTGEGDRK